MKIKTQEMHFLLSEEELDRVHRKMAEAGIVNRSAYFRKMALDGYVVKLDTSDIEQMVSLLRRNSNNLNQIAKKVNATGRIYGTEVEALLVSQEEIWKMVKEILARLSVIR